MWRDAASQIFYSLSIGLGAVSALASYSKFQNNVISDAFLITMINSGRRNTVCCCCVLIN